jgi:cellulose synthase/poly-beta-1,6-N-acetylglucosamine synthase-like glycosyltransferase
MGISGVATGADGMSREVRRAAERWLLALGAMATLAWLYRFGLDWQRQRAALRERDPVGPPPPDPDRWPGRPSVSILVAAWNEAEHIERHLRTYGQLRYPERQLVLCAGGTDQTSKLARDAAGPGVVLLEQRPGEGKQAALRRCFDLAGGDVIMLTDADCDFSDEAFLRLIEPIACNQADVVTGSCEPLADQRTSTLVRCQWFGDRLHASGLARYVDGLHGRNSALRRQVVKAVGAFDPEVRTGTDYVLSQVLRLGGFQILAVPSSRVASEYPSTTGSYLRMWRRWNKNLLLHGARYDAWRDVRGVLAGAAVAATTWLALLLTPLVGAPALGLSAVLLLVATLNRLRRVCLGAELAGEPISWRLLMTVPLQSGLDMAAVLLAVYDALMPGRRSRW